MANAPFKMKGSPMQRNFGVGRKEAPTKKTPLYQSDEEKIAAADAKFGEGAEVKAHSQEQETKRDRLASKAGRKRTGYGNLSGMEQSERSRNYSDADKLIESQEKRKTKTKTT